MRTWRARAGLAAGIALLAGCSAILGIGEVPAATDTGGDGGSGDGSGAGPSHAAAGVRFTDRSPLQGIIAGHITIAKATDESDVTHYDLYWGSSSNVKLAGTMMVTSLAKTGADLTYDITGAPPPGASAFLVFTANGSGEMGTGPSAAVRDNFATYVDLSAGQPAATGYFPSTVVDTANQNLLVASQIGLSSDGGLADASSPSLSLVRCNLDGGTCAGLSGTPSTNGTGRPSAIIGKNLAGDDTLWVVAQGFVSAPLTLLTCSLQGATSPPCVRTDLTASSHGAGSGVIPVAALDTTLPGTAYLDVVTEDDIATSESALFRCLADGTGCSYVNVSNKAGRAAATGLYPAAAITGTGAVAQLLIVTKDGSNANHLGLFECAVDANSCAYVDVGVTGGPGPSISVVVDSSAGPKDTLDIVTDISSAGVSLGLVRCPVGDACSPAVTLPGQFLPNGRFSAVIDPNNKKLLVAYSNADGKATLDRCALDGTACDVFDLSAGQPANSGLSLSAAVDLTGERLLVASDNAANGDKVGLYSIGLW